MGRGGRGKFAFDFGGGRFEERGIIIPYGIGLLRRGLCTARGMLASKLAGGP